MCPYFLPETILKAYHVKFLGKHQCQRPHPKAIQRPGDQRHPPPGARHRRPVVAVAAVEDLRNAVEELADAVPHQGLHDAEAFALGHLGRLWMVKWWVVVSDGYIKHRQVVVGSW